MAHLLAQSTFSFLINAFLLSAILWFFFARVFDFEVTYGRIFGALTVALIATLVLAVIFEKLGIWHYFIVRLLTMVITEVIALTLMLKAPNGEKPGFPLIFFCTLVAIGVNVIVMKVLVFTAQPIAGVF